MYAFIFDPISSKKIKINSKRGIKVLNQFMKESQKGGHKGPCAINSTTNRCKKSKQNDGNCILVNGKCKKNNRRQRSQKPKTSQRPQIIQQPNDNCALNKSTNRCKKSKKGDNNCMMGKKKRCVKMKKNNKSIQASQPIPRPIQSQPIEVIQKPKTSVKSVDEFIKKSFIVRTFNQTNKKLNIKWNLHEGIDTFLQNEGFNLKKKTYSGSYGTVYLTKDGKYAIKVNKNYFEDKYEVMAMIKEMAYHRVLADNDIGPKLHPQPFYIGDARAAIVLKRYRSDVHDYLDKVRKFKNRNNLIRILDNYIVNKTTKMIDLGIICFDLKPGNMLVDYDDDGTITEFVLTDFGSDFCCNLRVKKLCDFFEIGLQHNPKYLDYLKIIIFATISKVALLYTGVKILKKQVDKLRLLINDDDFIQFCNYISSQYSSYVPQMRSYLRDEIPARLKKDKYKNNFIALLKYFLKQYSK